MFAIVGVVSLILFIYVRPQEVWELLQQMPLLYIFFALAVLGIALDVRLRSTRLFATPQLPLVLLFCAWALITVIFRAPRTIHIQALTLSVSLALFLTVAYGIQSFRSLALFAGVLAAACVFVAAVGVHQGFAPYGCVLVDEKIAGDQSGGTPDGRPCQAAAECYLGDAEPGGHYMCERIGLAGTTSVSHGRVRYRGVLQDPNELALAACVGLPLSYVVTRRRSRPTRWLLGLLATLAIVVCTVFTGSRGGQFVFLAVIGAYFLRRFGWKGAIFGFVFAVPVLLLGGRSGAEADSSTTERIDCWYEAISMFRSNPLVGVGFGQFGEYHYLTAHNSYLLTAAELGFPGLVLFTAMIYSSAKIPWIALRRYGASSNLADPESLAMARAWAMAMLAAMIGMAVGIFFLSFAYHYILWVYFGLLAAFYCTLKRHDPDFHVRLGPLDWTAIVTADTLLVVIMFFFTRTAAGG